ncbi:hypothetical protein [Streptomyces sp. NPDC001933]|uniref:hypothetical protein n=1 Tax=Streptomyces sp. NPDC001933 TaxID=3364626 RepID=UPI0036A177D3
MAGHLAGDTPRLALSAEAARGQVSVSTKSWTLGRGEDGEDGPTQTFGVDTSDLKDPVRDAVLAAGWTWRGVTFGSSDGRVRGRAVGPPAHRPAHPRTGVTTG